MTKLTLKICIIFGSLSVLMSSANADTYTWVDDTGVVNYSEQKPRGVAPERVTRLTTKTPGSSSQPRNSQPAVATPVRRATQAAPSSADTDQNLSKEQKEMLNTLQQAEEGRQQQLAKIRQDNCERSRRALGNLSANDRIRVRTEDGTQRVLPEEERQQRIAEAQQGVVVNCAG